MFHLMLINVYSHHTLRPQVAPTYLSLVTRMSEMNIFVRILEMVQNQLDSLHQQTDSNWFILFNVYSGRQELIRGPFVVLWHSYHLYISDITIGEPCHTSIHPKISICRTCTICLQKSENWIHCADLHTYTSYNSCCNGPRRPNLAT